MDLRVAICVPSHGGWTAATGQSIANMVQTFTAARYDGGEKVCEVIHVSGSRLPDVRHLAVHRAMKFGATHLLFIDADMGFPRDALQRLLRHGKPVVAANYSRRHVGSTTTAWGLDGKQVETHKGDKGLVPVEHAGTGLMLIRMDVFDAINLPYFHFELDESGIGTLGEDVYFCRKVREAGIPVFVDQELSWHVEHVGEHAYTLEETNVYRREEQALLARKGAA